MPKLVIVESPSKAKTISKILGEDYIVEASIGHISDLPKSRLGIDIEDNFQPEYVIDKNKEKLVNDLKKKVKKASQTLLATDPDREGEAISKRIAEVLELKDKKIRVTFNEITKKAVKRAIESPKEIDLNRVNAQQARRILDRLVGYGISPLLWKRLGYSTSAGRVQSVALKLICELEDKIKKFLPEKFWTTIGIFEGLSLDLYKIGEERADKVKDRAILDGVEAAKKEKFIQTNYSIKKKSSPPPAPFKTSTLQQAASSELGFSPSKTMRIAQMLYSGIEVKGSMIGLITYMRTDSTRVSGDAKVAAEKYINKNFGDRYYQFRSAKKEKIQDAHEAVRPTSINRSPSELKDYLSSDQYRLYNLIYIRFLASQMSNMNYDQLELILSYRDIHFRKLFNKMTFDGYYKVYKRSEEDFVDEFPKSDRALTLDELNIKESETKPPSRFSESSLIKKLEKEGIGRPSTYATIPETLKSRDYVELKDKRFIPTNLGYSLKDILDENFPNIMNIKFTSEMEDNLDKIEEGAKEWVSILKDFYSDLSKHLTAFKEKTSDHKIKTDVKCEECGGETLLKSSRFGKYIVCDNGHKKSVGDLTLDYEDEKSGFVKISSHISKEDRLRSGVETDVKIEGVTAKLKKGPYGFYLESEVGENKIRRSIPKGVDFDISQNVIVLKDKIELIESRRRDIEKSVPPCEKCGSRMSVKDGKWGMFLSCSNYPKCKNIRKIEKK